MNNKKKQIIMLSLGVLLLVMAVGYASAITTLQISGTASLEATWDVAITGISEGTPVGTAYNKSTPTYTGTTATFDVGFKERGDSIDYEVTITNNGTIDAVVNNIDISMHNGTVTFDEEHSSYPYSNIAYICYGIKKGDVIKPNDSKTFNIKIDSPSWGILYDEIMEYSMNFLITFEQYTNQEYSQVYALNDRVLLDDGEAWRVLKDSGDTVKVIREESISDKLVFDENGGTNFETSTLKTYLNTTYKEILPEGMQNSIIGDINIPNFGSSTNSTIDFSNDGSISDLLFNYFKNCNYGSNTNICNMSWFENFAQQYYLSNHFLSKYVYMKYNDSYALGISAQNSDAGVFVVDPSRTIDDRNSIMASTHPVMTIKKDAIK